MSSRSRRLSRQTSRHSFIVELPAAGTEDVGAQLVRAVGSGLPDELYAGAAGLPLMPELLPGPDAIQDTRVHVARFVLPAASGQSEISARRVRSGEWGAQGARRAPAASVAEFCLFSLATLGMYDERTQVFTIGEAAIDLGTLRMELQAVARLWSDPPHFNAPGYVKDLVDVAADLFTVTTHYLGQPGDVLCQAVTMPTTTYRPSFPPRQA